MYSLIRVRYRSYVVKCSFIACSVDQFQPLEDYQQQYFATELELLK